MISYRPRKAPSFRRKVVSPTCLALMIKIDISLLPTFYYMFSTIVLYLGMGRFIQNNETTSDSLLWHK
jgi:hypothetical protein